MPRYCLILAAATEWDEEDRIRGDLDVPVSTGGRAELESRLREVARYKFRQCWAGTDQPADETAARVADVTHCRLRHHPGLREVRLGVWQGLLRSDVRRKHRRVYAEWLEDPARSVPAGGESLSQVADRVRVALHDIARRTRADELVALVLSPTVAAVVACLVEERPLATLWQVQDAAPPLRVVGPPVAAAPGTGQNAQAEPARPAVAAAPGAPARTR